MCVFFKAIALLFLAASLLSPVFRVLCQFLLISFQVNFPSTWLSGYKPHDLTKYHVR